MKFPGIVNHQRVEGVIYGRSKSYGYYRLVYRAAGKRIVRSFQTYAAACKEAVATVRELSSSNQSAGLSSMEAGIALVECMIRFSACCQVSLRLRNRQ